MANEASPPSERVRAAEVIAALSLATDLAMGVPLEHGLQSTLLAMRLADRLNVDAETAAQIYYACQLFYVGCTANADAAAELFGADDVRQPEQVRIATRNGRRLPTRCRAAGRRAAGACRSAR